MAENTLNVRFLHAYKTEADWKSADPVPKKGEMCFSSDKNGMYKVGNGTDKWSVLPYNHISWNNIDGKPSTFTPSSHTHDLSTMINTLSVGTATPTDADYYVSQYAGGGDTTTTYHRRPVSSLWNYIKAKLSTVATSGSYNDLSNKPTIGNGTITIKQAGTSKGTFTTNQTGATTIELTDNNTWRGIQNNLTSTSTTDSLSAAQGKALKDLVDANKTSINNIQVGGRNLARNTAQSHSWSSKSKYGSDTWGGSDSGTGWLPSIPIEANQQYILSFDYILENATEDVGIGIGCGTTGDNYTSDLWNSQLPYKTYGGSITSGHFVYIMAPKNTSGTYFAFRALRRTGADTLTTPIKLTISNFKLEKGNKATDWTPAPEDAVNSSLLLQKNSAFNDGAVGRVSYYDAQITNTTNNATWSAPTADVYQIYHNDLSVANYWTELAFPVNDVNGLAWRQRRNSKFYGWYRILDSNNYKSYVTPANIGAATASHTHSISDITNLQLTDFNNISVNKSISSILLPAPNTLAATPYARDYWHDHFAFLRAHKITSNQISADGTTWTDDNTDLKPLFIQKERTPTTILTANMLARRFVIKSSDIAYSMICWFEMGVAYNSSFSHFNLLIEKSADNSTWVSIHDSTVSTNSTPIFAGINTFMGNESYLRFTFKKITNLDTGKVSLTCIKAYTYRKGDQGLGIECEYPYDWDTNSNILPIQHNSHDLGSSGKAWRTVYAVTFKGSLSGNASTASKLATARTISFTGSVTGSGTFDGSGNLSITTATNHTHSQYYDSGVARSANTVLAAPNGSDGKASFRKLVAADLPSHTHNYAGSSSVGGSATSAVKLDVSTAGSATQPVYFSGGKPVACTYTLGKSVPSDAKFTDTNTWIALKGATTSADGTAGYAPAPTKGNPNRYLRSDGTWAVPPDTNTVYTHPTSPGNRHIPAGGSSGQILRWSSDGTAVWGPDNNTTYSVFKGATNNAAGGSGLVPAPATGNAGKYLRGDGTWATPTNTVYTHPNSGVTAGTYRSVTVNAAGHVTAGTNPTTLSGYGITDAAAKTHTHAWTDITDYLNPTFSGITLDSYGAYIYNSNTGNIHFRYTGKDKDASTYKYTEIRTISTYVSKIAAHNGQYVMSSDGLHALTFASTAANGTATATATISNWNSNWYYTYYTVYSSQYFNITGVSLSNGKLTVSGANISNGTHTGSVGIRVLAFSAI